MAGFRGLGLNLIKIAAVAGGLRNVLLPVSYAPLTAGVLRSV